MTTPDFSEIQRLAEKCNLIPVCREIYADITTPIALLRRISSFSDRHFLLESVEGGEKWGRYSFLGFDPIARVTCKDGKITIEDEKKRILHSRKPLDVLRSYLSEFRAPELSGIPPLCRRICWVFLLCHGGIFRAGFKAQEQRVQ